MSLSEKMPKWTGQQIQAIEERGGSLLVSAAAGAGKTAVLVERVIRRITDPADPLDLDRLLVVTFTNAAAAEMRERIGSALAAQLERSPSSRPARRQLALLPRASITTIHSFCLEVLRRHFYHLELDPRFRVADATETALLQAEALDEVFERLYEAGEEVFIQLVDHYGGERDDNTLRNLVLKLYSFSRSHPQPETWLKEVSGYFNVGAGIDGLPWGRELRWDIVVELTGVKDALENALALSRKPSGPSVYAPLLESELAAVEETIEACLDSWGRAYQSITALEFGRLRSAAKADEELRQRAQRLRNQAKEKVKRIRNTFFSRTEVEWLDDLRRIGPLMVGLVELVNSFAGVFKRIKSSRNLVDFNDLEHLCLAVLNETGEYRSRFNEVLVDEYQDINPVQEAILDRVSRPDNRFMVGDVKQSIYRFRLAEPGLFLDKYLRYPTQPGHGDRRVDLSLNFRSRLPIIQGINFLFRQIMTPYHGEMEYDEGACLRYGADYPPECRESGKGIELRIIEPITGRTVERHGEDPGSEAEAEETGVTAVGRPAGQGEFEAAAAAEEGEGEDLEDLETARVEARWAAQRISRLVNDGEGHLKVYDRKRSEYRDASYRDIVILMRSPRGWATAFTDELQQAGIPVYADLGSGYFNATEVEAVLSLLRVIDNPRQDIPLAGVLRSPWVGLGAEDLARIRLLKPQGDYYDALLAAAEADGIWQEPPNRAEPGNTERLVLLLREFLRRLDRWRDLARQGSLADLIWDIYQETGYYNYVGGMPGGTQRQANLRALHDRARQYEATSFRGLFRFLRFIERLQESGQDLGTARVLGEGEDVVRVMSIHKSKGLEFPVVFVAGLGKRFNLSDLNQRLLLHRTMGLGPELVDPDNCLHYPTLAKLAIRNRLTREMLAEELRILYVAMTRAQEKLIMVGSLNASLRLEPGEADSPASEQLPDYKLTAARRPLDWIIPAVVEREGEAEGWSVEIGPPVEIYSRAASTEDREIMLDTPAERDSSEEMSLSGTLETAEPAANTESLNELVARRLSWRYPYREQGMRAAKLTVTEAKNRIAASVLYEEAAGPEIELPAEKAKGVNIPPSIWERPRFLRERGGLTAAERGSVVHLVMQHLRLDGVLDADGIRQQVDEMRARELITSAQSEAVDAGAIAAFFKTPLGKRMTAARRVYRELPFILGLPAQSVYPSMAGGEEETVVVQGIIDCLLDEGDKLVLIDFKTDQVYGGDHSLIKRRYQGQLELYAQAVERIWQRPVGERYLYLFSTGETVLCS